MHPRAVLVASGLLVAGMLAGGASAAPVTVRDVVGDGNGINGQSAVTTPVENTPTPGSQPGYDIASVTISSTFTGAGKRRVPKDLVVRLELAGEPLRRGVAYFVRTGWIGDCNMGVMFEFSAPLEGSWTSQIRTCSDKDTELWHSVPLPVPTFGAKSLTWTVPYDRLTSIPYVKLRVGDPLPELGAEVYAAPGLLNAPVMDILTSTVSYRLGS